MEYQLLDTLVRKQEEMRDLKHEIDLLQGSIRRPEVLWQLAAMLSVGLLLGAVAGFHIITQVVR